jgi:CDP-glucose 4,6-dehydratase
VLRVAAQPRGGVARLDPVTTLETNIRGTWNVREAGRLCATRQIVVASSDKAYGPTDRLPYIETHPLQGRFPYDVSKSCADLISTMYAATYGLPVCMLRCANLFGGGDLNFSRTIPGAVLAALKGERFVIRSDGQFVRDFLYVKDAAEAYTLVAERLAENRQLAGEAFNFGMGLRLTVLAVVQHVLELMERTDLEPIIMNQASAEIREQYLSAEKAKEQLGWAPRYDLVSGLTETIAWYRQRLNSPLAVENDYLSRKYHTSLIPR